MTRPASGISAHGRHERDEKEGTERNGTCETHRRGAHLGWHSRQLWPGGQAPDRVGALPRQENEAGDADKDEWRDGLGEIQHEAEHDEIQNDALHARVENPPE